MDEADLNSMLENRGWDVAETTERNGTHTILWSFGECVQCVKAMYFVYPDAWSYKKTKHMAKEWVFMTDIGGVKCFKSVEYYTADRKLFLALRNRAVAIGLKRIGYDSSDGRILYKFEGPNYQVSFVSLASGPKGRQSYIHLNQLRKW